MNAEKTQEKPTADGIRKIIKKIQVNLLKRIRENHEKSETIHQELLNTLRGRDDNGRREAMRKFEESDKEKWRTTLESWNAANNDRILNSIFVGLVRKIRERDVVLKWQQKY